ncbi:unnamed protein product [Clonostachys rhizophaga]|uniref:FAD-binding FR-type domain-containing protein n=1 Tax=Clonostachys rhizophaga TaxID=160324 RepID=A0A9N9V7H7_9HYPO|nr:unnamed protein product [Clonostachys rhizophaga]
MTTEKEKETPATMLPASIAICKISLLGNIQYVAFGLGNSNYQHYNRVVGVVVTAIDGLGARALMFVTKADDADGNTEEKFPSENPGPNPDFDEILFKHYLEISAAVSADTLGSLLQSAPSLTVRLFLGQYVKDRQAYIQLAEENHLTLGRLLRMSAIKGGLSKDGDWANLSLSFVAEVLEALRPRLYSISSSSMLAPRKPAITALVVEKPLRNLSSKNEFFPSLHVAIRKSKSHPPAATKDIIMKGAGTGIAPFRAFLLERARFHAMSRPVGRTILFFGCRDPKEDYIYQEELEQAATSLPGAEIVTTFSRTQYPGKAGRGYVQDAVARG